MSVTVIAPTSTKLTAGTSVVIPAGKQPDVSLTPSLAMLNRPSTHTERSLSTRAVRQVADFERRLTDPVAVAATGQAVLLVAPARA